MNILIIPSFYPNEDEPLLGSFFKEQAIELSRAGHRVVVLNASFQNRDHVKSLLNYKVRKLQYNGVVEYAYNVPALGIWRLSSICSRVFLYNINRLWKCIVNEQFDIIHVHSFYPAGLAARTLSEKIHVPLVYTEHASGIIFKNLPRKQERQLKKMMLDSDKIISVSRNLKCAMKDYTHVNSDICVIPNMVNTELFHYIPKRKSEIYTFLTVGRLDNNKRIDRIIQSFYELARTNKNIRLRVVGDGEEKGNLVQLVQNLRLNDKVIFEGKCSREKVAKIMQEADSFVLDSKVETFGVVYIEALACGLPIVIPKRNSSNIDILNHNCVLVEEDTIEGLTKAMQQIYDNRETFNPREISQRCVDYYSGNQIAKRLTGLYQEVIDKRK